MEAGLENAMVSPKVPEAWRNSPSGSCFGCLPDELLALIFAQLDPKDLAQEEKRVCRRFYWIIMNMPALLRAIEAKRQETVRGRLGPFREIILSEHREHQSRGAEGPGATVLTPSTDPETVPDDDGAEFGSLIEENPALWRSGVRDYYKTQHNRRIRVAGIDQQISVGLGGGNMEKSWTFLALIGFFITLPYIVLIAIAYSRNPDDKPMPVWPIALTMGLPPVLGYLWLNLRYRIRRASYRRAIESDAKEESPLLSDAYRGHGLYGDGGSRARVGDEEMDSGKREASGPLSETEGAAHHQI